MVHLCTALSMSSVVMPGRTISPARSSTSAARRPAARMRSMPWEEEGELEAIRWRGRVQGWERSPLRPGFGSRCRTAGRACPHMVGAGCSGALQGVGRPRPSPASLCGQTKNSKIRKEAQENIYIILFMHYACLPFRPAAGAPPPKRLRTTSAWARCETQAWDACRATIEAHKVDALIAYKCIFIACFYTTFLIQISCLLENGGYIVHGKVS